MKVVCINNQYDRYNYKSYLTIGKIYDGNYDRDYLIIWIWEDDKKQVFDYPIDLFETLSDYRNSKINRILGK